VLADETIRIASWDTAQGRVRSRNPNLLRVVTGTLDLPLERDESIVVETNIDDMNPQLHRS